MAQDDAHVFCTSAQIAGEIDLNLQMVRDVYQALGFERLESKVATMPEKHLGTEELWRTSEAILCEALTRNGFAYEINPGEGAFYGPKIEIYVPDALKRRWQLATIQLDYNMPENFDLTFTNAASAEERPVMIHRAILGSLERFIGVLLEHTGGVLPFWLAPEQARVLSLSEKVEDYARRDRRHPQARGLARRQPISAQREAGLQGARGRAGQGALYDRRGRARGGCAQRVVAAVARGQERSHGA